MKNKIALWGKGKTGGHVLTLLKEQGHTDITVFDSKNPPNVATLKQHDVLIVFVPGPVFADYLAVILESKIAVVTGSTGGPWPSDINQKCLAANCTWVYGRNFALGMNLAHQMITVLSQTHQFFDDFSFKIHEVHHTKKLDSPSGTAIAWKDWVNVDHSNKVINITAERIGDIVGTHIITLKTPYEEIILQHKALSREIFASGAIWAAKKILQNRIKAGFHYFEQIALKELSHESKSN